jgi:N-acetylglucosaminyldiphosphoundecaprenol N-acetyl-beta-D-mannosaminyltransferase
VRIGSLDVHDVTPAEVDALIASWLDGPDRTGRYVCTPNADYVVRAQRDRDFRDSINAATLRVPDGMWVVYASRLAGRPLRATVTGRLLIPRLADACRQRGLAIGFMGAGPGIAASAAARLSEAYSGLVVSHTISPPMGFEVGSDVDRAIVAAIRADPPAVLCVALGAPTQELWMHAHQAVFPSTLLVGVGAGVDIIAGRFRTAPPWMTRFGLEWMFRLAQEPRRLARRYLIDDPWILWWAARTRLRGS